jgi:acetylornithine/N-succinyldiaminopimelate aminotransferase
MPLPALAQTYTPYPMRIARGVGDRIIADDGRVFFDFYGGHCVASTGHCHPHVVKAIQAQAESLLFYSTAGDVPIRAKAAERLIEFARADLAQVFFCNSGAEANENAIKLSKLITGRNKIASLQGGWHGRTLACLSATEDAKITKPYQNWLLPSLQLAFEDLTALAAADFSDVACVIVEPIQSLAGVRVVSDAYLQALSAKTKAAGSVLIFDEIQTGVGRLGLPFAASKSKLADVVTSAKGIASGLPMGAVLMQESIAKQLRPQDLGSTFGGGPIACAALIATLQAIEDESMMANAMAAESKLRVGIAAIDTRIQVLGQGLLLGLQMPRAHAFKEYAFANGILLGASSNADVLRLMPPLNLTEEAIAAFLQSLRTFIQHN